MLFHSARRRNLYPFKARCVQQLAIARDVYARLSRAFSLLVISALAGFTFVLWVTYMRAFAVRASSSSSAKLTRACRWQENFPCLAVKVLLSLAAACALSRSQLIVDIATPCLVVPYIVRAWRLYLLFQPPEGASCVLVSHSEAQLSAQ